MVIKVFNESGVTQYKLKEGMLIEGYEVISLSVNNAGSRTAIIACDMNGKPIRTLYIPSNWPIEVTTI